MICLPFLMFKDSIRPGVVTLWTRGPLSYSLWQEIIACGLAGVVVALMSCVWLGWYFAVSLAFQGHSNEAGSTAQIENYKQFIRFRITKNSLTGYVIGIDEPKEHGSELKPRIVDVFTLRCPS